MRSPVHSSGRIKMGSAELGGEWVAEQKGLGQQDSGQEWISSYAKRQRSAQQVCSSAAEQPALHSTSQGAMVGSQATRPSLPNHRAAGRAGQGGQQPLGEAVY